ncbi:MAG: metalloregulator ArsR/SmtB family transcription factor [Gemmatimonadota bacterium]
MPTTTRIRPASALRTATEPRRLEILELIWDRERTVSEIAEQVPVSIAAVSQHLAKLRSAGLVTVRPAGRQRFYTARKQDLGSLAVVLESFWTDRLDRLKAMAERATPPSSDPDTAS